MMGSIKHYKKDKNIPSEAINLSYIWKKICDNYYSTLKLLYYSKIL